MDTDLVTLNQDCRCRDRSHESCRSRWTAWLRSCRGGRVASCVVRQGKQRRETALDALEVQKAGSRSLDGVKADNVEEERWWTGVVMAELCVAGGQWLG